MSNEKDEDSSSECAKLLWTGAELSDALKQSEAFAREIKVARREHLAFRIETANLHRIGRAGRALPMLHVFDAKSEDDDVTISIAKYPDDTVIKIETVPLAKLPGLNAAIKALSFVYPKKYYERVFVPIMHDEQEEFLDALDAGMPWKANWIKARLWLRIATAAGLSAVISTLSAFVPSRS